MKLFCQRLRSEAMQHNIFVNIIQLAELPFHSIPHFCFVDARNYGIVFKFLYTIIFHADADGKEQ